MKFAWDTVLTDLSGRTITTEDGSTISLGSLAVQALMTPVDPKTDDGAAKFKRYQLALKVSANEDIDVSGAAAIKDAAGAVLTPLPLGRIWDLLEDPIARSE
jgi:hypothetical protein